MQSLLEKFNGINEKEYKLKGEERRDPLIKKFRIKKLPDVLIFQISRFAKNNFFTNQSLQMKRSLELLAALLDIRPGH